MSFLSAFCSTLDQKKVLIFRISIKITLRFFEAIEKNNFFASKPLKKVKMTRIDLQDNCFSFFLVFFYH